MLTVIFTSRYFLFDGYLLPENLYVFHPIKYQQILINDKLH